MSKYVSYITVKWETTLSQKFFGTTHVKNNTIDTSPNAIYYWLPLVDILTDSTI